MKQIFEQQRAEGYPALTGSELTLRLPIRETVLNEILGATVMRKGSVGPVTGLAIRLQSNNRISIPLELSQFPLPKHGQIDAVLGPWIDFHKDPRLLLMLAPSGWLGVVIKLFFGAIPGIQGIIDRSGDNIFVDIKAILVRAGAAEYLPYIQTIGVRTDSGVLVLDLLLRINEKLT